jgi:transposase
MTSMAHPAAPQLTIGVDTHLEAHVAHANDQLGRPLATLQIPTTPAGYQQLLGWAHELGEPVAWGVEGTGSYGAALARFLAVGGQVVVEINDPTAKPGAATASPTPWMPGPPPRPCRPGRSRSCPRPAPARWR